VPGGGRRNDVTTKKAHQTRPRAAGATTRRSKGEDALALLIRAHGLPEPVPEYVFAPPRRWRFDFAWPPLRVAVEVEGGAWVGGRHTRGKGFEADAEKYNTAALLGWIVLRFTSRQATLGMAKGQVVTELIRRALDLR
jgi:very-short-patch-repair endonuclease